MSCEKAFRESTDLITHKHIHTGEKPFKCMYYEWALSTSSNLTKYKLSHREIIQMYVM